MRVYVVMGNDFPDAVFSREADAFAYCESKKEKNLPKYTAQRIYWKVYPFEMDKNRK